MSSLEQSPARPATVSVDAELGRQMVESQILRDRMKAFELQQAQVYQDFIGGADAFGEDIVKVLDVRLFPRLDAMFEGAKREAQERISGLTPGYFADKMDLQLTDFESRFAASIYQFSALREAFERTEMKIVAATERMDAIWADQDSSGVGGWRTVMRSVSSYVDKNRDTTVDSDRFKGPEEVREPSQPAIPDFNCPKCYKQEVRRLYRNTVFEEMLRIVAVAPYRCNACHAKFYRMRVN